MRTVTVVTATMAFLMISASAVALMQSRDDPPGPEAGSVELPDLEVLGEKQELALRLIKSGLESSRSEKYEHRNRPFCWFDKATGSHMTYLYCAKNKYLGQSARWAQGIFGYGPGDSPTFQDNIYRSRLHISPGQVRRMLDKLGPSDLNDEIVNQALRGAPMPDRVPSVDELDRFVEALAEVRAIRSELSESLVDLSARERNRKIERADRRMTMVIKDAGLTVERYNEISDLVERFESLRKRVREQLASR